MNLDWRRTRVGVIGLLVLASCFHGPVPTATLAPASPDSVARVKGPFAVAYAAPRGRVLDRKQPGVTVLFSRAVRSVDTAADEKLPPVTITTKAGAAVPGAWRWTGTRGLLFTPEVELPGGSDFVVAVPPSVTSLDGTALGKPYTMTLETEGPTVASFTVSGPAGVTEHALPSDPTFRLEFDQAVEPGAVTAAGTLRVYGPDGDRGETIKLVASREPASARPSPASLPKGAHVVPESYVVLLKPEKPLALDHQVELSIAPARLRGSGGPRPMTEGFTRTMRTHGGLRFVDFYCPRIAPKGRCKANGDVKVVLSNPVPPDELKRHVRLGALPPRPPIKPGKTGAPRSLDPSTELWLGVAPKIGDSYKVTLTAGMKDIYGTQLDKDATFDLVIEAPLSKPTETVATGVPPHEGAPVPAGKKPPRPVPAPRPDDTRPRRERLPYALDLGLAGHILEASGNHKLPVGAVNVPTYATLAAPLTDAQAVSWTFAPGHTQDFVTRNGFVSAWTTTHAEVNERAVQFIDLDAALAKSHGRGPALVVLSPPGTLSGGGAPTESLVSVTDLGVSAKMSPFGSLVWVTQLSTGKPVAGASVSLRTAKGGNVFEGTSDAQGLVVVPADRFDPLAKGGGGDSDDNESGFDRNHVRDDAAIVVRSGDDWTVTRVAQSPVERRLASGFEVLSKEGRWAGMLFADRGVFRPGETAKVSGIVRVVLGGGLRSIPDRDIRIELKDGNGEQLFDGRAKCDAYGSFAVDVPIPKTALIGIATITATALAGGKSNTSESGVFSHEIKVLAFKPNEFKVSVEADKPAYVRGDTAVFAVHGEYLYGAPMAGATVTTTVARQEVPFVPAGADGFTTTDDVSTGDYPDDTKAASEVDSQDGTLDPKGSFSRKVSLAFDDQRRPERVAFDADVQDISRRDVSARSGVIVHPGEFYVGLRLPKDRFVAAGAMETVEVAALEPAGAHRAGVKVKVELVERRWNSVTGEQPDGRPMKTSKPVDVVITACDASTTAAVNANGRCDLRVPAAGYFIVRATATDPRRNTVRASTSIYGTEDSPKAQSSWEADDRHGIKLEANKKKYAIGETARILLRSPFKEGQALVTVERNGVLFRNVVPIKGPVPVVDVPIRADFYPNAFVSVVAVRGRVQAPPATGADLGGPDYRLGWTELTVDQDAHRLAVRITEPKAEYQPGTTAEADVVVKDQSGKPVQTALTFYVVDEGVLALTSYVTPDPLPAFVQPRKSSVFTFDNREALGHVLPMKAGERLSPLGYEYAVARNTDGSYDKGDDGGDGGGMRRADFRTTVYFEAGHPTDAAGKAHFSFKLPDNLTTFRVMAVAAAADDRFGSGESKVTTYRRLMARPALPRLIRVGDALEASVIVSSRDDSRDRASNKDAGPMKVDVKMAAKGLTIVGANTRSITMPRGGQMEVRFPVKATHPGEALLSFDVRSGSDVDMVDIKRPVELPVSVESSAVYGETSGQAAIALGDLSTMRPDFGGLDVRVSSSALVGLGQTIDRLTEYPYGCTEQLTSKLLPLLSATELAKAGGAHALEGVNVNGAIDASVEALVKRQNSDGGFGFWDKTASEPWLSAYAMLAISGAAEKKHFVPRDVVEQGHSYLNFSLANFTRKLAKPTEDKTSDADTDKDALAGADAEDKREAEATARVVDYVGAAFVGDTLATLGWANPGALNVLYDARAGQRLFAEAALLHAMAKAEMSGPQVKDLVREVEGRLRVGPNGVDIDEGDDDRYAPVLDSHARTLAMVLRALLATNPKHTLAPRIARTLLALRQNGAWRTTQEDTWSLLALADYRRLQEAAAGAIDVQTSLGGSDLLLSKFPRGSTREDETFVSAEALLRKGPSLSFDVRGGSPAFYSAELKYATTTLPTRPRDEGLFVTKYVRSVEPAAVTEALAHIPQKSADAVNAGDLVLVDLLFESAEPREHIVLDDPLPAGLEALDYDLDTTSQAARDAESKHDDDRGLKVEWLGTTFRAGASRREVRDDRVVTFFDKIKPGMYRVHYLARAMSVGSFVVPPTRVEAMYSPEVYGTTAASALTVRAKP